MNPPDSKQVLWENVSALMEHHWKEINVTRLARDAGIGGSASRIKKQETSVGVEILDKIAVLFPEVKAWHLLMPNLDPTNLPVSVLSRAQQELYDRLKRAQRAFQDTE